MVFFRMAVRNVARNWNRTGMIVGGMAAASAIMTLTLALSTGYAEGVDLPWRAMVGADILIYPNRFVFAGPAEPGGGRPTSGSSVPGRAASGSPASGGAWELRYLGSDLPSDALFFHPSLTRGYLSPAGAPPAVFDLDRLPAALAAVDGVVSVRPGRLLAAHLGGAGGRPVVVRGRDVAVDTGHFGVPEVVSGRYFTAADEGELVAIVNSAAPGLESYLPGDTLVLDIPALGGSGPDGLPVADYSAAKTVRLRVVGRYSLYLGQIAVTGSAGPPGSETGMRPQQVSARIDGPDVWVPAGTFERIWAEVAGGPPGVAPELLVTVESMFQARTVAARLAELLPEAQVLTVPQEVALSGIRYQATMTSADPPAVKVSRVYYGRPALGLDVKVQLSALAFVVAGLLVVANMYVLVTQRRREIGILKALGAAGRDIVALFLVEALGYALVGSFIGFGFVRLVTLATLFSSSTSLVEGALLTVKAGGAVVGLTVAVSLLFGIIPAWAAARTPSATLLGD